VGIFRFKQFSIDDTRSSLKVGTDGVLLGAWCDISSATRLLDIGTGSGVIALMLAQRSSELARIDAIELNPTDAAQAQDNVLKSPWPGKVVVYEGLIQDFNVVEPYDHIVCNPPYFTQSLLSPDHSRSTARHDTRLPVADLLAAVSRLLNPNGVFSVILPALSSDTFETASLSTGLHLIRHTRFYTRSEKPQERSLMSFSKAKEKCREDQLVLFDQGLKHSSAYVQLTGDFYL